MKKTNCVLSVFILLASLLNASPIKPAHAKQVAQNFYTQNSKTAITAVNLAYTGLTANGQPAYYAFNINNNGFVIVSGDDNASPIIGYSTENNFVSPEPSTTIGHWLATRTKEIESIRNTKALPTTEVALTWMKYETNSPAIMSNQRANGSSSTMSAGVAPLVQSVWNQSPFYNAQCPGGSVTGCVATAMAQIMRYWSYPAKGTGSSSYCDCSANNFSNNYGTQTANYGATTYNWANMPLNVVSANADVAKFNYQCGVSVNMDYDPAGSGAWVITSDAVMYGIPDSACAQQAYVKYFQYDPNTIHGLNRSDFDDTTWMNLLKNDINIGRPIQYVGDDPAEGGHTWVCDGYDQNDYLHMNWGWGGSDNGYFFIDNLLTTNGGFNPSVGHQAIIGIVPIAANAVDAGVASITAPVGYYCGVTNFNPVIRLQNFGSDVLTSCDVYYRIDNGTLQTQNWTGSMVTGQAANVNLPNIVATPGTHTLVCYSSNPNASVDANVANNQSIVTFNVTLPGTLPVVEGFENYVIPSTMWTISHIGTGVDWAITSNAAATGSKSIMIDNNANTAGNTSILQTSNSYDISSYTSPILSFAAAYQEKLSTNRDKLQVFVSVNCGASWYSRWARFSNTLSATSGIGTGVFTPTPSDFITYTVNLSPVVPNTNVLFRWEFVADVNGPGNNLYLDDINISDAATSPNVTSGINNIETTVDLNLYPNPSNGKTTIEFNLTEKHTIALQVTDLLGRTIETVDNKAYQAGQTNITIGADKTYQAGVYMVNINIDGQHISKKVIVQ